MSPLEKHRRWVLAQRAERRYWNNLKKSLNKDEMGKLTALRKQRANDILNSLREHDFLLQAHRILEIGAGATGVIYFLEVEKRYVLEPLSKFFKTTFPELVNQKVHLIQGMGEELPFCDGSFNLVILDNVLDHMVQPQKALTGHVSF